MKTKYLKGITALSIIALLFSSCLKDDQHLFTPEAANSNVALLYNSGPSFFTPDAITGAGIDTVTFAVGITQPTPPTTSTAITLAIDNTVIATYNAANPAITYLPVPAAAIKFATSVTIPAGQSNTKTTIIVDRTQLDPSQSYMIPVKIVSAGGGSIPLSTNFNLHYFHIIGNDFAGTYHWDYRRYNNGLAGGTSAGTALGQVGTISPVSPTEFEMITGYNGNKVAYDITFTRTVVGGIAYYTNWKVSFDAATIAAPTGWTAAGISLIVPPVFTIPPPTDSTKPKIFEMNYQAGGASPRYIDDTYY